MHCQVPLDLGIRSRPQARALEGEVARQVGTEGFAGAGNSLVLERKRVLTESDAGEHVLCQRPRLAGIERRHWAERQLALPAADAVLHDPRARAAGAHAHAGAGEVVVEEDLIGHARRQGESFDGCRGQLHCGPLGRFWVGAGCNLLRSRAIYILRSLSIFQRLSTLLRARALSYHHHRAIATIAIANDSRRPNPSMHETKTDMLTKMAFQKDPVR